MKKTLLIIPSLAVCCLMLTAQGSDSDTLRHYADKMNFWVGTTIQGKFFSEPGYTKTLGSEFNSGVSIILMKGTQPQKGQYNFSNMDRDIKFARSHDMKLFGQALVYRSNTSPDWMGFEGRDCRMSADELDKIMKDHIQTLVKHGGDDFYGWEVVNETLAPDSNGCWSKILGQEGLISKAFHYAHDANPNAMLLLNDTFGRDGLDRGKIDTFFKLVRKLKSQGVPIDAVGTEMHLEADQLKPSYMDDFQYFLDSARKAEVQSMVTEMDVYQGHPGAFADNIGHQKEIFYNIAHACLKDSNCKGFTVWGLTDKGAWQPTWRGITDTKPLLFGDNYEKKPAYYGLLEALKAGR